MAERGELTREHILDVAEPLILHQGFVGTSLDDILKAANLTKGAFFHHFRGKGDLARALIERHARNDIAMFEEMAARAEAASPDPLEQTVLFLKAFEDYIVTLEEQPLGCIYAAYIYESTQFDPEINDFVAASLRRWMAIYVRKFDEVLARYTPALPVTARQLAEMIIALIEGGLVLARAYDDARVTARQSEQFRNYLALLFGVPEAGAQAPAPEARPARAAAKRRRPKAARSRPKR